MGLKNVTVRGDSKLSFEDHHTLIASVCITSLTLGLPLACNTLWHLKEVNINILILSLATNFNMSLNDIFS